MVHESLPHRLADSGLEGPELQTGPILVPSSLDVVEDFFGEILGPDVIRAANKLPLNQAAELMNRLGHHYLRLTTSLGSRGRTDNPLPPTTGSHYRNVGSGPLYAQEEALLRPGITTRLSEVGILKYLALYCERTLVADPLMLRSYPPGDLSEAHNQEQHIQDVQEWSSALPDRLSQLLPVADLVRSGCFVLTNIDTKKDLGWDKDMFTAIHRLRDPYLQWLIHRSGRVKTSLNEGIVEAYPLRANSDDLWAAAVFAQEVWMSRVTPFTANPLIRHHLLEYSKIMCRAAPQARAAPEKPVSGATSATFGIPSLADIPFRDIAALRRNEAVFAKLRGVLVSLNEAVGHMQPGDYPTYQQAVSRHAGQAIQPALEELQAWHRQTKKGIWGSKALGGVVALVIDAVAGGLPIGGIAGKPVEQVTGKHVRQAQADIQLARSILQSILPAA